LRATFFTQRQGKTGQGNDLHHKLIRAAHGQCRLALPFFHQNLTLAHMVRAGDDALIFHLFHQSGGLVVPDAEDRLGSQQVIGLARSLRIVVRRGA